MKKSRELVTGWGRFDPVMMDIVEPATRDELATASLPGPVGPDAPLDDHTLTVRGLGRSYGDAAQHDGGTAVLTTSCRRIEWIDRSTGLLRAEAGATIGDLIATGIPVGYFVPVTPGTRNVTVGGAIAADIHGKNHHVDGTFGQHVRQLTLRLADDSLVECSPTVESELFWATVGGMGLTGLIVDASIQMAPVSSSTISVETTRHDTLDELMTVMAASDAEHDFSVAWVDLLTKGRSVLTQGGFAEAGEVGAHPAGPLRRPSTPSLRLPWLPPVRWVQRPFVKAFNELWFRKAPAEPTTTHESITAFFHPLDAIRDWNRLYGSTGFVQWQCVVESDDALRKICADFASQPAFFVVLKRFGPGNEAPLSFPKPGWTLAVDLPATPAVFSALQSFDDQVVADGGRLYLAKDARMSRATFEAGYPRLDEWKRVRRAVDPHRRFTSDLAKGFDL